MLAALGLGATHSSFPIVGLVWLLVLASVTTAVARWIRMPYTVALVLVGLGASALGVLSDVRPTSDIILLVFLPHLCRNAHTATAAPEEATIWGRVILNIRHTPSTSQDDIRPVVQIFRDDRLMLAFINLTAITKVSVIERILQNERYSRNMHATFTFGHNARLL